MQHRVFLVDDHPLVREWLTTLINQQPDMMVCGEADDSPQALQAIGAAAPEVVLVDLALRTSSGLELIKDLRLRHPGLAVLVLSMHEEPHYVERALRAGARGYVMKRESTKTVVTAIRTALNGQIYLSEQLASTVTSRLVMGPAVEAPVACLSDRELEVFELCGKGLGTKAIADALRVSMKTVQAYEARIKEKLGVKSMTELLREAVRWEERKLLQQPPPAT